MPLTVRSYAKINLGLLIGPPGARADGFHELRTVYQTIGLHDTIKVDVQRGTGVEIRCRDARVPQDESNTCWKAAERVLKALKHRARVVIQIDKALPVQGGMGAASSNAAVVILALEKALKRALPAAERMRIGEEVGSDVPQFLVGGTSLGIGRGEQVYPMPDLPAWDLVVATPSRGVSTPKAFADWDAMFAGGKLTEEEQSDKLNTFSRTVYGWLMGSASGVPALGRDRAEALLLDLVRTGIENDFERVVFPQVPALRDVKRAMERNGSRFASLSGSGSTVFGIFESKMAAQAAAKRLMEQDIPAQATVMLGRGEYWKGVFSA